MSVNEENPIPQPNAGDDLPDWLRELRGDAPPSSPAEPPVTPAEPEAAADEADDLPDWLLDSTEEAEAAEASPETEDTPVVESADEEPDADGEALWQQILAEEGVSLDDVGEERPEGADEMSVADWMAATADESAKRQAKAQAAPPPPIEAEPAEEMAVEAEVEAEPEAAFELEDDGIVETDGLPDWLREDQPVAEVETPDWLLDESVASAEPAEEMAVEAEVEAEAEMVEESVEPVAEATGEAFDETAFMDSDGLPDWMLEGDTLSEEAIDLPPEAVEEPAEPVETGPDIAEVVAEEDIVDTDSLPDWLKETEVVDEAPLDDQQIPSWLAETAREQGVGDIIDIEPEADNVEIPEWLQMASGADGSAEGELPEEAEVGNLPVWLDEPSPEAVEPTDEATVEAEPIEAAAAETPVWIEQLRQEEPQASEAMDTLEAVVPEVIETEIPDAIEPTETAVADDLGEISAPEDKLAIAQAAFKANDVDEALAVMYTLVEDSESLSEVIDLLQQHTAAYAENAALFELLGDAHMRDGQLNQALHAYKQALEVL